MALVAKAKATLKTKAMKRLGNLFEKIVSIENLELADLKARKGKSKQYGVIAHDKNRVENIKLLRQRLVNREYKTSTYITFKIYEPKERLVFKLPYFPDRITHHAIMNILEPIFVSMFTADTYSCIKGRGIHGALRSVKSALKNVDGTRYCLKLDIRKFYPSIDHDILKQLLRRKFKDRDLLWLLDEIISSADGIPIGNFLSQFFANFYLTYFDHWIKETEHVMDYLRYADDIVILSYSKEYLHAMLSKIRHYFSEKLKLEVKDNYQIFPVAARGIDFVGYVAFHTHVLMRKSIKQNFARMIVTRKNPASIASYNGWASHCDSKHLLKKLLNENV